MSGLGDLPGGLSASWADNVSADGNVIIGQSKSARSADDPNAEEAFRWENGSMSGLGDLDGGVFWSEAYGTSADGSVVVGWGSTDQGKEAFLWTSETGMVKLSCVLTALGVSLSEWAELTYATDVSDDGLTIVGFGQHRIEDPNDPNVPKGWVTATEGWVATLPEDWMLRTSRTLTISEVNPLWGVVIRDPNKDFDPNRQGFQYPCCTQVQLTGYAEAGKSLRHWEIYHDPNYRDDPNYAVIDSNNPISLCMDSDKHVVAVWRCGSGIGWLPPIILGVLGLFVWVRRRA